MKVTIKLFLVLSVCHYISGCSISKYKRPLNQVDQPAILPKGMQKHSVGYNKQTHEFPSLSSQIAVPIVLGLIPLNRGIGKNWESPAILPFYTYLFGENKYYDLGRIEYNKYHHLVGFGANGLSFSAKYGLEFESGVSYRNVYVYNGLFRNQLSTLGSVTYGRKRQMPKLTVADHIYIKLQDRLSLDLVAGIEFYDLAYKAETYDENTSGIIKYFSAGWTYNLSSYFALSGLYRHNFYEKETKWSDREGTVKTTYNDPYWSLNLDIYW